MHSVTTESALDSLATFCLSAPDATLLLEVGSQDGDATIVACNEAACRLYGYTSEALLGQPLTLLSRIDECANIDALLVRVRIDHAVQCETVQRRGDGQRIEVALSLTHIVDGIRDRVVVVARDITAVKRTERRLTAQYAISRVLTDASHFLHAAPQILAIVGAELGWDDAMMWCMASDAEALSWTMSWHATAAVDPFEAVSLPLRFERGEDLVGRVWQSGEPCWIEDLDLEPAFPRAAAARSVGLRSALAFPIQGQVGFFGVIEFWSTEPRPVDPEMLAMAAALGRQCGAYIDRRRAESRMHFQADLLDVVAEAVIATDKDGRITYWNRFAEQLYGYTQAEAVGRNIVEVTPALATVEEASTIMNQLQTGEIWSGEFRVRHRDGRIFPAQVTNVPIFDAEHQVTGIVGVSVDITKRKRDEERLQFLAEASVILAQSLDIATTFENLGRIAVPWLADWCSINMIDRDGSLQRIAGFHVDPAKEAIMNDLRQHYAPELTQIHAQLDQSRPGNTLLVETVQDEHLQRIAPGPEQLAILRRMGFRSAMFLPLYIDHALQGVMLLATSDSGRQFEREDVAVAEDLANRAVLALQNTRLYQDAQAAIRTRDDFLSIAAHELKTPVTSLVGYAEVLQRRMDREQAVSARDKRALQVIREQAERMAKLVTSLLDVSRIETGHFTLDRQPVDLYGLLRSQVEAIQPTLHQHTLVLESPDAPIIVDGDALRLEQVIQNLLQNAVKYSPDGGPIVARVEEREAQAMLSIRDHGIGIPPDALEHLFERFFRAPNVRGSSIGVGIGLYVVKEIVDRHHGSIDIDSTEGQGSTFTISIPLAGQTTAA